MLMNYKNLFFWILRLVVAVILLQTLYFKFSGAAESVYIFTQLGVEPYGRYFSGVIELIAALLILYPKTTGLGAFLSAATMAGAITGHIGVLGIEIEHDGGTLFFLALAVFVASIILAWHYQSHWRKYVPFVKK